MKGALILLTSAGLVLGAIAAQAGEAPGKRMQSESGPGASKYAPPSSDDDNNTPGQQMKNDTGPGASEYAPGQNDDDGPGASAAAPGHNKPSSSE